MALTPNPTTSCQEVTTGTPTTTSSQVITKDKAKHAMGDDPRKEGELRVGDVVPIKEREHKGVSKGVGPWLKSLSAKTSEKAREQLTKSDREMDWSEGNKAEQRRGRRRSKPINALDPVLASLKIKRTEAHADYLGPMKKVGACIANNIEPHTMKEPKNARPRSMS